MMYSYGGWWIIGLIALALFLLFLVVLVVAGIAYAGRSGRTQQVEPGMAEDPLEILRRRYARGEMTREEYQSMREDLRQ